MSREEQTESGNWWFPFADSVSEVYACGIFLFNSRFLLETVFLVLFCIPWKNKSACGQNCLVFQWSPVGLQQSTSTF